MIIVKLICLFIAIAFTPDIFSGPYDDKNIWIYPLWVISVFLFLLIQFELWM